MIDVDFEKVENLLLNLLASVDQTFNQEELKEVQDFIDANEFGLALETFSDIVVEENKKIARVDLDLIKELTSAMDMDREAFHQKLEGFLKQSD